MPNKHFQRVGCKARFKLNLNMNYFEFDSNF